MRTPHLAFAALLVVLAGCAAEEATEEGSEEAFSEEALSAGSVRYVGRFVSADGATQLTLASAGTYALVTGAATERGAWSGSATQLRLTPTGGAARIYRATLGTGDRAPLSLVRAKVTLSLVRTPESVWGSAYAGKKWGITVANASSASFSGGMLRQTLFCALRDATITCGGAGWGIGGVSARIADDGTFASDVVQGTTENRLHGRITAAHVVTVDTYVEAGCLGGPGTCERKSTDRVVTAQAVPLCTYPGQTFPNGDWVADALVLCTSCTGACVEDRP